MDAFLDDFEGVPRDEAIAALQQAYERFMEGLPRWLKILFDHCVPKPLRRYEVTA